ncbi:MAG: uracil phosphoribosyltransferase [Elusimicrobia bacterium]|nr:uracil phosphoribosyltransferase [Elusimicrobiota bacterium]
MQPKLVVCDHPLLKHKLAHLRDKRTPPAEFRRLMQEAGAILGYEATRGIGSRKTSVLTPIKASPAEVLAAPVALVAVLRAGLGLMEGALSLYPEARIGHIGLYRNEETLNPVRYYVRLPKDLNKSFVVLCDPMLATGGSAAEAVRILKMDGARKIALISLLAAKDGIRRVHQDHPDVAVYAAAVDAKLNSVGYIVPGLGDAGDRLFGT